MIRPPFSAALGLLGCALLAAACIGPEPQHVADGGGGSATGAGGTGLVGGGGSEPQENGASCATGEQCISGFCPPQDGVCCDMPCASQCQGCLEVKTGVPTGTCAPIPAATDPDADCAEIEMGQCDVAGNPCYACDGALGCRKINGAACGLNMDCISGFCNLVAFPWQCQPM